MAALKHPKGQQVIVPDDAAAFYLEHGWQRAADAVEEPTPEPKPTAEPEPEPESTPEPEPESTPEPEPTPESTKGATDGGEPEADAGRSAGVPAKRARSTARKG